MLIIFDMGGVCTSNASENNGKLHEILGLTKEKYYECLGLKSDGITPLNEDETDLIYLMSNGIIGQKEFWTEFGKRAGKEINTDWFHCLFHPIKKEGTYSIIGELKEKGHRVICGTNTIESHYQNHIERGDYEVFDQTYASHHLGVSKPELDFWKIILTAENEKPENAVFIDDKMENCEAAESLGLRVIPFENSEILRIKLVEMGLLD